MNSADKAFSEYGSILNTSKDKRIAKAKLSMKQYDAIDIYSQGHLKNLRKSFIENIKDDMYRMVRAFPTFKLYFVEEDEEELKLFDDLYGYNSVQSIEIHKSKNNAADTAVITVSNIFGNLDTQVLPPPQEELYMTKSGSVVEKPVEIEQMRLKSGTKIQLRMGYSSKVNELELTFTGRITNVEVGDMITFHAVSFGAELLHPKGWDYREGYRRAKEAVPLNVLRRMLNYPEVQNFGKSLLSNPTLGVKIFGEDEEDEENDRFTQLLAALLDEGPKEMNIYMDRSNRFFNTVDLLREFRVANTTPWEVFQSVARMYPGYVAAVVPYDNRVTMFFGKPNQPYYWTSGDGVFGYKEQYAKWVENKNLYDYKKITKVAGGRIFSEGDTIVQNSIFTADKKGVYGFLARAFVDTVSSGAVERVVSNVTRQTAINARGKGEKVAGKTEQTTFLASKDSNIAWNKLAKNKNLSSEDQSQIEGSLKNDFKSYEKEKIGKNVLDLAVLVIRTEPEKFNKIFKVKNVKLPFWDFPRGFIISLRDPQEESLYLDRRNKIVTESQKQDNVGFSPRQKPFRGYHYKDSMHHIVANNIRIDLDSFHNEVVIEYPKNIWRKANSAAHEMSKASGFQTLAVDKDILPEFKRTIVIRENNIETASQAKNCALSHLKNEVSKLYQGELVILGDPRIKPHDIVFIYDNYTDMYGPVEVREVVHSMTEDTGFVTTITPDMYISINEPTGIPDVLYNAAIFSTLVVVGTVAAVALPGLWGVLAVGATSSHFFRNIGKDFFPLFFDMAGKTNVNTREPIKICPLVYDGKPYIAGFEGKDKKDWNLFTLDGFKKGWKEAREGAAAGWVRLRRRVNLITDTLGGGK